jgi:hypothetical protein
LRKARRNGEDTQEMENERLYSGKNEVRSLKENFFVKLLKHTRNFPGFDISVGKI